jgi:hypothetical protein
MPAGFASWVRALLRTMAEVYEQRYGCGSSDVPAQATPLHDVVSRTL